MVSLVVALVARWVNRVTDDIKLHSFAYLLVYYHALTYVIFISFPDLPVQNCVNV